VWWRATRGLARREAALVRGRERERLDAVSLDTVGPAEGGLAYVRAAREALLRAAATRAAAAAPGSRRRRGRGGEARDSRPEEG